MKCNRNRNRLHCQLNRNRRLLWRLNLDIFTLHHCALNRGCGGWVSSFIIVFYGYVSEEPIFPSVCVNPDSSNGKHSVCSEFSHCYSYPSCWPPDVT